jgi:hypothetical protein
MDKPRKFLNYIADGIGFLKVFRREFRLEKQLASPNKYMKSIQFRDFEFSLGSAIISSIIFLHEKFNIKEEYI